MSGYTKLFGSIVNSSIWFEPNPTRIVWITMLAMANRDGVVESSIPGLAARAVVTLPECEAAIETLSSPDTYSKNPANEGRRIERVKEGFRLLNYDDYRHRMSDEDVREKARIRKQRQRDKSRDVTPSHASHDIAEADTKAEEPPLLLVAEEAKEDNADSFLDAWNSLPDPFPKLRVISDGRRTAFNARMRGQFWRQNWRAALKRMTESDFCRGKSERKWIADAEFFLRPDSVAKLMEGKYDNRPVSGTPKTDDCRDQWKPWLDAKYPAGKFPQLQRQYEYADDFIKTEFFRATRAKKAA
jgi:hypothetical protein